MVIQINKYISTWNWSCKKTLPGTESYWDFAPDNVCPSSLHHPATCPLWRFAACRRPQSIPRGRIWWIQAEWSETRWHYFQKFCKNPNTAKQHPPFQETNNKRMRIRSSYFFAQISSYLELIDYLFFSVTCWVFCISFSFLNIISLFLFLLLLVSVIQVFFSVSIILFTLFWNFDVWKLFLFHTFPSCRFSQWTHHN